MKYSIKVNSINSKEGSNIKGFATVVFGDSFKITNIAILENKDKDQLFVSMPRYKSSERGESGAIIYKDVCNPIMAEFREELYTNILEAYERAIVPGQEQVQNSDKGMKSAIEMPEFSVTVSPYERDESNIKGLARIYIEESFIVNNVNILQGKENIFVTMPAYKTKQINEHWKPIYQEDAFVAGMREANQKIANTFRIFADKEAVDYSQSVKKFSKTDIVKKPWLAKIKLLEAMELRLDAAIDKTENLARDVEIDRIMMKFDSLIEKAHTEQVISMVAEPDSQYGAEVFDAYEQNKNSSEKDLMVKATAARNYGKYR